MLGHCVPGSAGFRLRQLARVSGGVDSLADAREILSGASGAIDSALGQLARVADMLFRDYPEVSLGFDFCELRGYNYHTGLVFAAYVPGHGESVAKGGRYDAIGSDFAVPGLLPASALISVRWCHWVSVRIVKLVLSGRLQTATLLSKR